MPRLRGIAAAIDRSSDALGQKVTVDPLQLLTERSAIARLRRRGRTSCGGGTRLLRCLDGWMALTLARTEDVELVPAWLEAAPAIAADELALWEAIAAEVGSRTRAEALERGVLLGLPIAALPDEALSAPVAPAPLAPLPLRATQVDTSNPPVPAELLVADLSALWAGPLCTSILHNAGAKVVKVEARARPDGARAGPAAFFDLLNAGKRSLALDFASEADLGMLRRLLRRAHLVVGASRPRALASLGIDPDEFLRGDGPCVWVSITGYGRDGANAGRVAFGDDAAVGGGLVSRDDAGDPVFCVDAVADPATGMVAAAASLDALRAGGRWHLEIAMSEVAAFLAGPTLAVPEGVTAAEPASRRCFGPAPALGRDNDQIIHALRTGGAL